MGTYRLDLAYNGAPFCGFARQPGLPTVQGSIEHALGLMFRQEVETTCAGRTDTGVHARAQVVSFELPDELLEGRTEQSLLRSLNALTDDGIAVRTFARATDGFSARFDAKSREYRYFIFEGAVPPVFSEPYCWYVNKELDHDAMAEAAQYLIGEHDFKSFCMAASAEGKPTCREVTSIELGDSELMGEPLTTITIKGNAFLHSMVRAIVGSLVLVGKGKRTPHWMAEVLAACDRRAAGENAPSKGLVLWDVRY